VDILILLAVFTLLCAIGVPVAFSLGLSALVAAFWIDIPLEAVMLKISDGVDNFRCSRFPSSFSPARSWPKAGWPGAW